MLPIVNFHNMPITCDTDFTDRNLHIQKLFHDFFFLLMDYRQIYKYLSDKCMTVAKVR